MEAGLTGVGGAGAVHAGAGVGHGDHAARRAVGVHVVRHRQVHAARQEGRWEQALDRHRSMSYLECECLRVYRRAESVHRFNVGDYYQYPPVAVGRCKLKLTAKLETSRLGFKFEDMKPGTLNTA